MNIDWIVFLYKKKKNEKQYRIWIEYLLWSYLPGGVKRATTLVELVEECDRVGWRQVKDWNLDHQSKRRLRQSLSLTFLRSILGAWKWILMIHHVRAWSSPLFISHFLPLVKKHYFFFNERENLTLLCLIIKESCFIFNL